MKDDPNYYCTQTENIICSLLTKWECTIIDCAVRLTGEFSAMDIHAELGRIRTHSIKEKGIQLILDRLVTKKLIKKRYVRQKFLKFRPLYQLNLENQVYSGNSNVSDLSAKLHQDIWKQTQEHLIGRQTDLSYQRCYLPFPYYPQKTGCLSEEEKQTLIKIINEP